MTTIAWKNGILAADRMWSDGDTSYECTKLVKTKTHALACSGAATQAIEFVNWFRSDRSKPCPQTKESNLTAIVMNLETGACERWNDGVPVSIEDSIEAAGSGADIAVGAMCAGASAVKAIKIACERNVHTGFGVDFARAKKRPNR